MERPANGHWTVETLREYLLDKFAGLEALFTTKIEGASQLTELALNNSKEAVTKAENANNERFKTTNEWRQTVNDITAGLTTKAQFDSLAQLVTSLTTRFERFESSAVKGNADRSDSRNQTNWGVGLAVSGGLAVLAIILTVIDLVTRKQ
jgi:hypothetical protein